MLQTRKLEFIFADAIEKGYSDVITVGNKQSNHVRTTMMAAKELGLQGHCIYYAKEVKLSYFTLLFFIFLTHFTMGKIVSM